MDSNALGTFIMACAIAPVILGPIYMWWSERPTKPSKPSESNGHGGLDGTTMAGFSAASGGCV